MRYSTFGKRVSRFFRQRGVRERLAQVSDPRHLRGRRWALPQVLETVLGALVLQVPSCHRLDEATRIGPPPRVGELRLAPIPDATFQWILPQVDRTEVRQLVVGSVRAEGRRKSISHPDRGLHTLAIDGKCLWSGRRGGCQDCQCQGAVRVHRVMRALRTSARPRLFLDQHTLGAAENEMGAFAAFWAQLLETYGRLDLVEVVTLDAGYGSLRHASLIDAAGYGYVLALKDNQPELLREAQRLLEPMAASQRPEAKSLERDHGPWVRRSLWRTQACAGWLDWTHLRQVWLVRTAQFARQTTPRSASAPIAVADHDYLTNLPWNRLDGVHILGVVRGHWGIENNGVRTLDMEWEEERAWCTTGAATDGLGLLRLGADNVVGLLKGRYRRAPRYRAQTLRSFVDWIARVSGWQAARGRVRQVAPAG
jgi:hypothetical protein